MTVETSSEPPGPDAGRDPGGVHSHSIDEILAPKWRGLIIFVAVVTAASIVGLVLTVRAQSQQNRDLIAEVNRLTEEGFDCVVAQLGEHRINSARAEEANAAALGYTVPRDDRVALPNPEQLEYIEAACIRFFAEQERQQERQDAASAAANPNPSP